MVQRVNAGMLILRTTVGISRGSRPHDISDKDQIFQRCVVLKSHPPQKKYYYDSPIGGEGLNVATFGPR